MVSLLDSCFCSLGPVRKAQKAYSGVATVRAWWHQFCMRTLAQPQPLFAIYHHMAGAQGPVMHKSISGIISDTVKAGPASRDSVIGTSGAMIL